jgi:hypothetical protein
VSLSSSPSFLSALPLLSWLPSLRRQACYNLSKMAIIWLFFLV